MYGAIPAGLLMDIARSNGVYTQLSFEDFTPPELFIKDEYLSDVADGIDYISASGSRNGTISHTSHPYFENNRNWLEKNGYINVQRQWSNGDRVLKPFYLNGVYFDYEDTFPSAVAMRSHIKWQHKYNQREIFIQNVSIDDIKEGNHKDPTPNSMLISIVDTEDYNPTPKYKFREVHNFKFIDAVANEYGSDRRWNPEYLIQKEDSDKIVDCLVRAEEQNMNVIVHCVAGLYRSGAIVEFALEKFRFNDTFNIRRRNEMVYDYLNTSFEEKFEEKDELASY